jgi:hypothetical protein
MSVDAKKSYGLSLILLLFGFLALYGGAACLLILIPAAVFLWLSCPARFSNSRN